MQQIDPIIRQVIRNAARAAALEMQTTLIKTAHSPLIYEVQDFGVIMTNRIGQLISEGSAVAGFLACLPPTIQRGLEIFGDDGFREGDVVLSNEPYDTGTHISDVALYTPIFYDGNLVGFAAVMAHWADIGGMAPGGWCPTTTSVHQEGLIFSHNKLYDGGTINRELHRFILKNVRLPAAVEGDLNAKIAACHTGCRRYQELCERYGAAVVEEALCEILNQSEARMRQEIRSFPNGTYQAETFIDNDGVRPDHACKIAVTVTVEDDTLKIDWSGSDPVAIGPVNHPMVGTTALCGTVMKYLTMPHDPTNDGHLRPLIVTAPHNTIVSAEYPAPCDSYGYVAEVIIHLLIRALANAVPERCPAATYQMYAFYLSRTDPRYGRTFIYGEPVDGGGGAFPHDDGPSGIMFVGNGDAPNIPVEVLESRFPVRVLRYTFNPENCGYGKYRGGYGVIRDYEMLEDNIVLQTSTENNQHPLWGMFGGGETGVARTIINAGTDREVHLDDRVSDYGPLMKGDTLSLRTPNGGGWGDPSERELDRIAEDIRNDLLDVEQAVTIYGVDRGKLLAELAC
ncbi:MAG: hydantoinase B/oxoprolinase family protein [Proteobacteria bacterium]|nr:hydantoinase B/oxoprolinase family protein [Pseudomonadota bacterium]